MAVYTGSSAAAPALSYDAMDEPAVARTSSPEEAAPPRRAITYQPSLFPSREVPRIVPFETIAPGSVQPLPRKTPAAPPRQRPRKVIAGQQSLEFSSAARTSKNLEGAIYCDAPVAISTHRVLAGALDGALVLIALGMFGLVFRLAGGEVVLNGRTLPLFLSAAAAIIVFYRLLWCFACGDSPGMRWTNLALINFDGQAPTRRQRVARTASGFLSLAAGGLGLLWALVDEETLTWHDHISKTFPTPR
ncbi:MAG TPA: RDD family protein [Bryobacteraceae bacterium]|nr:RDD family protein [Bryobacteraceae bacterium]